MNDSSATFLTLPIELRLRIYGLTFQDAQQHLAHFTDPPLIEAFPELRAEALPEYLKVARLLVIVRSEYLTLAATRVQDRPSDLARNSYGNNYHIPAGRLSLPLKVELDLNANNGAVEPVLHRLEFRIFHNSDVASVRENSFRDVPPWRKLSVSDTPYPVRPYHYDASISVQWDKKTGLKVSREPFCCGNSRFSISAEWAVDAAEPLEALAGWMVNREGFCGFTVKDVKKLAWMCR
jgi:hypothetical protein